MTAADYDNLVSELPIRQKTQDVKSYGRGTISELPIRQKTYSAF